MGLLAGTAVDRLAQKVHVAEMAGVLLDEVGESPTEIDLLVSAQSAHGHSEVGPGRGVGAGGDHLGLVCRDVSCRRRGSMSSKSPSWVAGVQ